MTVAWTRTERLTTGVLHLVISSCMILKCCPGPAAVEERRILFLLQRSERAVPLDVLLAERQPVAKQ